MILVSQTIQPTRVSGTACGEVAAMIVSIIVAVDSNLLAVKEHRSGEVTREFRRKHSCPSTGQTSGPCPAHQNNHIVPPSPSALAVPRALSGLRASGVGLAPELRLPFVAV
jgi:hypothetical protein